jgi:signal transduction histidine kinase
MIIKKMIGQILSEMGFVNPDNLKAALERQRLTIEQTILPEKLQRSKIVAEARFSSESEAIPMIGEILTRMDIITRDQLDRALENQQSMIAEYSTLEPNSLCSVMEMGALVNSSLNLAEVLSLIMKNANKVTASCASTLMLIDEKTGELVFSVPTGPMADELVDIRLKKGEGIAGWVMEHEQPVIVADVKNDSRFYPGIDRMTGFETKSILAVPMKAKDKLIGVMEVINKIDETPFTSHDALLLRIFSSHAAMGIENARLYEELKEQLEHCRQMEREMAKAEKDRALGQLSAGVAHDFNNVLMGIQGCTSLMLLDIDKDHPHYDRLKNIETQVRSGADLTRQLLGFSQDGKFEVKTVDLNAVLDKTSNMFGRTKKEITVHRKFEENLRTVEVNEGQIEQVLMNLYVNAWQAMPGGGHIYLETRNIDLDDISAKDFSVEPGRYVRFSIMDTGIGMEEKTKERIFEPFFTTREMGGGTGLGLATVYGIIKSHKGIIHVYTERGHGTTFNVYLPASEKQVLEKTEFPGELIKGKETILVIDDEENILEVTKELLECLGYRVITALSGVEAVRTYKASKHEIDLVLLDMIMPGMSGQEVLGFLKAMNADVKVILCSGYSLNRHGGNILDMGFRAFIQKPFNLKDIARKIRDVLDNLPA